MPLVKKLKKSSREHDNNIINKANNKNVSTLSVKGGKSVLDSINMITAVVNTKLGKYKDKYNVLRTEDEIMQYISKIQANHICALDTETSGLDPICDDLAGICLYTPGEKAVYIPYGHISYITQQKLNNQPSQKFLKDCFDSLTNIKWIFHNAKFDIRVMRNQLGIDLIPYWDTMLASKCIDENESAALKNLHLKYCKSSDTESLTYDKLFDGIPFTLVPIKTGYLYAAGDAIKTYELYEYQKTILNRRNLPGPYNVFMNIEMPTIRVIADMEDRGITLDTDYAKQLSEKYHKQLEENEKAVYDVINNYSVQINKYIKTHPDNKLSNPINISSPTQIAILLYDILGLQSPDKNKPRGTGEEILTALDHPLSKVILDYRGTTKLLSTYIDKMPQIVNPKTGRIHCSFNQYGAKTGRFSSDNPNMQNIPSHNKDIRKMFGAREGYALVGSDFSQQEPRTLAHMSGDKNLINAYIEGKDIYAWIASFIYGVPYEDCKEFRPDGTTNPEGKERRTSVKSIILGIMYSRGDKSIAEQLGISLPEAKKIINKFFDSFPSVKDFIERTQENAHKYGYVTTAWGRIRHLPDMLLNEYEFTYQEGKCDNFDPLDFNNTIINTQVPQKIVDKYTKLLNQTFSFKEKNNIKEQLRQQGIDVKDNGGKIAEASRQCVNSIIQGSSADMTKKAMIAINNDDLLKEWDFHLLLQVHDEVIGECPIENANKCAERLSYLMIESAKEKISVPMKCDAEITKVWYGDTLEV